MNGNYIRVDTTTSDDKNYLNQQHKQLNPTTFRGPTPSAARKKTMHGVIISFVLLSKCGIAAFQFLAFKLSGVPDNALRYGVLLNCSLHCKRPLNCDSVALFFM